ncbi:hypothetical protein OH77DRAFT_1525498 [Trametes cingulata]|nr:hypothetical protein OH77DRAFT_1525498 [Trametes cingulata]
MSTDSFQLSQYISLYESLQTSELCAVAACAAFMYDWLIGLVILVSRLTSVLANSIVLLLTWRATLKTLREARGLIKSSVSEVLLLNGSLYFLVFVFLDVAHIVMSSLSITALFTQSSYIALFVNILDSIFTSHFLLDLQRAARLSSGLGTRSSLPDSSVDFDHIPSVLFRTSPTSEHGSSFAHEGTVDVTGMSETGEA